ncbi:cation/H(+) antiporter 15-like [Malania oleifera]|uniref:cation/H(+) antiporter 15-like n=1 Tax=Malania oleifera TaxID=397392 RepID=UPI0025AEA44C|nr:cation/H(+) antiporter 15-like [Malania oleifera]
MGSVIVEPEDISLFGGQSTSSSPSSIRNLTTICLSVGRIHSRGIFFGYNPLHYSAPLLLLQLSIASAVILITSALLKPLGQPIMVSQILGGIILGPSFLSRSDEFRKILFPARGLVVLDAISAFGYMFYFFLIGVQMDPWILKKVDKKTFSIGMFAVAIPLLLSISLAFLLLQFISMDPKVAASLPTVAQVESVLAFPVIAHYLAGLKIINSEFGRMALTSSMVSGVLSFSVITITVLMTQQSHSKFRIFQTIFTGIALAVVIFLVVRPVVVWMIGRNPPGEPLSEEQIYALLVGVLVAGFLSHATGLNIFFGPLVLGMAIPPGPPIGSALVEKLDLMISWMFMPLFFVKAGLVINVFAVELKNFLIVQFVILISCTGKFMGAFLPALFCNMPLRDAVAIGLVMNAQGVLELGLFKMMKKVKAIDNEAFYVMCTSMVLVTGAITPIIKRLYDPSRRYTVYQRRTVMNSRLDSELRVLVCIHDEDGVPATINLIEACNPTKRSPIVIYLLHLVKLVGRPNPILIPYKMSTRPGSKCRPSEHIVNAFRYYEQTSNGLISVHPYTAISTHASMHDDTCRIALDRRTSLIIIPFHKRLNANGATGSFSNCIKTVNNNVLNTAPCSVAILVDRGLVNTSRPMLATWSSYRVAVIFFGGADDREALALGARMAGHPNINLTMVRLLENGNINNADTRERRLDNEVVGEFRLSMVGNYRVMYMEEVVMDASGTVAAIRSMEDNYELLLVGRRHDPTSRLMRGVMDQNELSALGVLGEVLASADFQGNTSVLVVQQHTNVVEEGYGKQQIGNIEEQGRREEEQGDLQIHRSV